jgi:hypothetical protein
MALQPGPRFQQIGDGDGGESPIPDKSGTGTLGRGSVTVPVPGQIGDGRPVPVPGQIGDGDGDGDRGVRALLRTPTRSHWSGPPAGRLPISPDPDSEPRPSSSELAPDSGRSLMGL